jgi:hypothetical protein
MDQQKIERINDMAKNKAGDLSDLMVNFKKTVPLAPAAPAPVSSTPMPEQPQPAPAAPKARARKPRPERVKKNYFMLPEIARQFDILRAEQGPHSGSRLIEEAMNLLFEKYGKPTFRLPEES